MLACIIPVPAALTKGIASLLSAHSGNATVARPNLKIIGQSIKHIHNTSDQICWIASRQIRSSDTPFKQYIATNDPTLLMLYKYDMAGSVARREQNFQF